MESFQMQMTLISPLQAFSSPYEHTKMVYWNLWVKTEDESALIKAASLSVHTHTVNRY